MISDIKQVPGDNKQGQAIACRSQVSSNSIVDITIIYFNTRKNTIQEIGLNTRNNTDIGDWYEYKKRIVRKIV